MKGRKLKPVGILMFTTFLAGAVILAQYPGTESPQMAKFQAQVAGSGGPGPDRHLGFGHAIRIIVRFLDLDEGQVIAIHELLAAGREEIQPIRMQVKELEEQLKDELNNSPSPEVAGALVIQIHTLRQDIRGIQRETAELVKAVLTDEQMNRAEAVYKAARLMPVVHAFNIVGLLPPPNPPSGGEAETAP